MGLPHDGVWARIGVSKIHGVGAIAIRDIPRGTNVFPNDQREIMWIAADAIAGYGNTIIIRHRRGFATVYGHLARTLVLE